MAASRVLLSVKAGVVDNGLGVVVMAAFGFVSLTLPLSQDICDLLILIDIPDEIF